MSDLVRSGEALAAVVAADRAVWSAGNTPGALARRNEAVRTAVGGGWTVVEIASAVGVRPADVQRWVAPEEPLG